MKIDDCIFRIDRRLVGPISVQKARPNRCPLSEMGTESAGAQITWRISTAQPCEDKEAKLAGSLQLQAAGKLVRRKDGLAHFYGRFEIVKMPAAVGLFSGRITLIEAIGVCRDQGCKPGHLSGWLEGTGSGRFENTSLSLAIEAEGSFAGEGSLVNAAEMARLTGILRRSS